jgi:TfoX/Sxy family transcriptional regulator of competence genes
LAYDEELAGRIRELLAGESGLTEKKMFGGLAFLVGGNMAVAASGQGGLLVRVDPEESDTLLATTNARLMEMRGRTMRGWLRVDSDDVRSKPELAKWVELGSTYARSLPSAERSSAKRTGGRGLGEPGGSPGAHRKPQGAAESAP